MERIAPPTSRIVHFEIALPDPEKDSKFYADIFGWKIVKWGGPIEYWLVTTGDNKPGIDGGILRRDKAVGPIVNTIGVDDLDEMMEKVKAHGGSIVVPKEAIPTVGWFCYAKDPSGVPFGMMQPDENAK